LGRLYRDGFIVNLLNPKTALFFLAFLPQFVDSSRGAVPIQIAFLGLLFTLMGLMSDGLYAMVAGTTGGWVKQQHVAHNTRGEVTSLSCPLRGGAPAPPGSRSQPPERS